MAVAAKGLSVLKLSEEILISKQHELVDAVCFCERRSVFRGELINCRTKCCKSPFFDYRVHDEDQQAFLLMIGFGHKEIEVQGPPQTVIGRNNCLLQICAGSQIWQVWKFASWTLANGTIHSSTILHKQRFIIILNNKKLNKCNLYHRFINSCSELIHKIVTTI